MTNKLLFAFTILLVVAFTATAADVSGKWVYQQAGRRGGDPVQVTLTLKASGSSLTGSLSRPGRGGDVMESPISDGKVDGDNISFKVEINMGGMSMTQDFSGTLAGEELKLKITRPGRDGNPMSTEVTAKKAGS
jgi:hypothetical protein